jgi:hypothetical protein
MLARERLRALPNVISSSRVFLAAGFFVVTDVDKRLGLVGIPAVRTCSTAGSPGARSGRRASAR